jgi:hypothetical protein
VSRRLLLSLLDWLQYQLGSLHEWIFNLGDSGRWFACLDCGVNTSAVGDYYSLHDDVWQRAHPDAADPDAGGMLCIPCLERRLGRRLNALDFTDAPINFTAGPRVHERICGRRESA